jgi:hypothetical protein
VPPVCARRGDVSRLHQRISVYTAPPRLLHVPNEAQLRKPQVLNLVAQYPPPPLTQARIPSGRGPPTRRDPARPPPHRRWPRPPEPTLTPGPAPGAGPRRASRAGAGRWGRGRGPGAGPSRTCRRRRWSGWRRCGARCRPSWPLLAECQGGQGLGGEQGGLGGRRTQPTPCGPRGTDQEAT